MERKNNSSIRKGAGEVDGNQLKVDRVQRSLRASDPGGQENYRSDEALEDISKVKACLRHTIRLGQAGARAWLCRKYLLER